MWWMGRYEDTSEESDDAELDNDHRGLNLYLQGIMNIPITSEYILRAPNLFSAITGWNIRAFV